MKAKAIDLGSLRLRGLSTLKPARPGLSVGMGTCGLGNGAGAIKEALDKACLESFPTAEDRPVVREVGCFGWCAAEPIVMASRPGKPLLVFLRVKAPKAARIARSLVSDEAYDRLAREADAKIESWDFRTSVLEFGAAYPTLPSWDALPFWKGQEKLVLRDAGLIVPADLAEYVAVGGYTGLTKALSSMRPESVIEEVKVSRLRGRGGAGFPTWRKWDLMRAAPGERKFVICNADEGDPGAYMNRNEIESDPHALVEGMAIGAYAMGATEGLVYVRAEYPLAVARLEAAMRDAREAGLLGRNILDSKFSFDLSIATGAGAFVCGEETALIASAEGRAGRPSPRPPFPAQKGLYGCPTTINNVETWCNIPLVAARGGEYFARFGTAASSGTKVFSLVGKVQNTGLVELPLGTRLDQAVYGMGGGAGPHKRIKALQSGGPSGGCVPESAFATTIDYEELAKLGAIMGSGGLVAMDQDNCMVDVARYFVGFTAGESCGKCAPCREGLSQMLRILDRISAGEAVEEDLDSLEELALAIRDSALCGLGQTAANPVLTTLRHFRGEYERHIRERRCEAGTCEGLFLALCENSCPLHMNIPGYLELLAENRLEEAFELTLRENPLPGTIGRICHFHCRMRCKRDQLDEPVAQGEIHRYLADTMYKMGRERSVYARLLKERLPPTGKKVSIVGAGPAGLAAAFWLVRLGHEVTIYDEKEEAGGVPRWGIPAYRLPREVLRKEVTFIGKLGVRFVFNTRVGRDLSWENLRGISDAVLVCVGALRDIPLRIPGETLPGVLPGSVLLERIARGERPKVGEEVIVVGGGNTAIDAARSARRLGAHVSLVYRRSRADMPANKEELEGALEEGIELHAMCAPLEAIGTASGGGPGPDRVAALRVTKMRAGDIDATGRAAPLATGEAFDLPCDTVIVAVGEKVDAGGLEALGVDLDSSGRVKADAFTAMTSSPGVYAAGDAVMGPATASEAMGGARRAAEAIDVALMGPGRFAGLFRHFEYKMEVPAETSTERAGRPPKLSPADRAASFVELSLGYTGEEARMEARRCLRCDVRSRVRPAASGPAGEVVHGA